MSKLWKKCVIQVFLSKNFKKLFSYLKSSPSNLYNCKILQENKNVKIWDQKCLIWVFQGQNFKKTIVVFEINTLKFVQQQNVLTKQKLPEFGTSNALFEYFWGRIFKSIFIFEISTLNFVKKRFLVQSPLFLKVRGPFIQKARVRVWVYVRVHFIKYTQHISEAEYSKCFFFKCT